MEEHWIYKDQDKRELKPLHGIILFLLVMLSFYTVIAWAQMKWGMAGLALTELYLLLLSIAGAALLRAPLKEVFPLKKPKWVKIFAVLLMWVSAYCAVIPLTMIVAYFFPEQMFSVSGGLNEFIASVPAAAAIFISCVMPGICEEALHRGFILKSFQSRIKSKWGLVLLMGILFGLFHGSVWRFVPTALLGGVLTYIMLETENMIYPALFHFVNNLLPSLFSGFSQSSQSTQEVSLAMMENGLPLSFLGIYIAMGCAAPFGFYTAAYLLRRGEPGREQKYLASNKILVLLVVLTVGLVVAGMAIFFCGLLRDGIFTGTGTSLSGDNWLLQSVAWIFVS